MNEFTLFCTLKFYKHKRKSLPDIMSGNYRAHILIKGDTQYLGFYYEQGEIKNFDEVVKLDVAYIDDWTIWKDIEILLKTVKVVFMRDGAK